MPFRAARLQGLILHDPAEAVSVLKPTAVRDKTTNVSTEAKRRPFTVNELRRILAVADDEWRSLIKFGLYTGQRLADVATLNWAQLDLAQARMHLTTRKTGKTLVVPLAAPLQDLLEQMPSPQSPIAPVHPRAFEIVNAQNGRVGTLSNQFAELLVAAGLRPARTHQGTGKGRSAKRQGMDVSFHSLRHTAVSLMKNAGIPDAVVQELVGHESSAMSRHYTHVGIEALNQAAGSLPVL
jgi:integrase